MKHGTYMSHRAFQGKKNKVKAAVNIFTFIPATNIYTTFNDDHNNC